MTCTRRGAAEVNNAALKALFPRGRPQTTLAADIDSNPDNYEKGVLKPVEQLLPSQLPIYRGARVFLTRNARKDVDYVNGMAAEVLGFHRASRALRVRTDTGHALAVYPWTDRERNGLTYYPVRGGYASTILKMQGAELPHVVVYLDAPGVPAAAYTAVSRVARLGDFLLAAKVVLEATHFVPAR